MYIRGLTYYENHFLYSNKIFQFIMGLRPYQNSNFQLFQLCTTIVYIVPIFVYTLYPLFTSDVELQLAVRVLQNIIAGLSILCIYVTNCTSLVQLKNIYFHIKTDYERLSADDELKVIKKYTRRSKIYTYCIFAIIHFYFLATISPSIFNICLYLFGNIDNVYLKLPISILDVSISGPLFYCLFIYQTIGLYILIIIASTSYSAFMVVLQHAFCQFTIMRMKIVQPFRKKQKFAQNIRFNNKLQKEYKWMEDIIKHHTRVIEYVNLLNCISKTPYLIEISLGMFCIVLDFINMFQLASTLQSKSYLIECCIYIGGSGFMTYVTFHFGQTLINHSTEIFDELCNVPFYNLSIKTQKLLIFMITRCIKPCHLSIGDLFISSHEVFSKMMQKAFSFATVYYNVR